MARTALACAGFALLAYAAASWMTMGFSVWTAEGARRMEVMREPVATPAVAVAGPQGETGMLPDLLADGRGVTIVDFIYTRCETVCSALGTGFQQLQARIADEERLLPAEHGRVRLLSISFDREHDSPPVLRRYAARLRADGRIWRFAGVPGEEDLRRLLAAFQVVVIADGMGGFQHNAALLVVDAGGRLVRAFDYAQLDEALAFARALSAGPA